MSTLLDKFNKTRSDNGGQANAMLERMGKAAQDPDAVILPIGLIDVEPQGRKKRGFEPESLQALAEDIAENGLTHAPVVRQKGSRYVLVVGERRLRAIRDFLKWDEIPCRLRRAQDDAWNRSIVQISENIQREDYDPIEIAAEFRRIIDGSGMTARALAKRLKVHETLVSRRLSLLEAPADVQKAISERHLPETVYYNNKPMFAEGLPSDFSSAEAAAAVPVAAPATSKADHKEKGGTKKRSTPATITIPYATGEALLEILQALAKKHRTKPVTVHGDLNRNQLQALLVRHAQEIRKKL